MEVFLVLSVDFDFIVEGLKDYWNLLHFDQFLSENHAILIRLSPMIMFEASDYLEALNGNGFKLINKVMEYNTKVVAIDAPLSHAKGYRKVDLKMKKLGFKVLPPGWRSMKLLVDRAIKLKNILEDRGVRVIETHPLSALRSSGYSNVEQLISELGVTIDIKNKHLLEIKDVVDAIIAAIVAKLYLESKTLKVSDVDGTIHLIPRIKS